MQVWTTSTGCPEGLSKTTREAYNELLPYITTFLTSKHPFRKGVVCPFMPAALKNDEVYFSSMGISDTGKCIEAVKNMIEHFRSAKRIGGAAAILIFDPDQEILPLLQTHIRMKKQCIRKNLMIGVLFKDSDAPSLHDDSFFPLRTPTPVIVIRDLTPSDLQFLQPDHHSILDKVAFLRSYIKKLSKEKNKTKAMLQSLADAKNIKRKYTFALAYRAIAIIAAITSIGSIVFWGIYVL